MCAEAWNDEKQAWENPQGNQKDHQGWLYLHEGLLKWLHGKPYVIKDKYDNGGQEPLWVEWDWLMQYERFRDAVEELKQPEYLFSDAALANLTRFLREEGAFAGEGKRFDHIHLPWQEWRGRAMQSIPMNPYFYEGVDEIALQNMNFRPDGLQVAIANTTIYALSSGRTERRKDGGWRVIVEKVAFFIHDGFDFNGDQWLGAWSCIDNAQATGSKQFDIFGTFLDNIDYRHFREATGYGCDFRTLCIPEVVITKEFFYDVS